MIGYQGCPLQCSSKSKTYDCFVAFLKVSDISIPLQSRSFPSAGSPPPGSGSLPRRFLKLTTLYGTGQQEIGEFQIAGDECDIEQRRSYQFESSDSTSVTKLHIYVDEVCSSGLTGHVTIDLKDFIGESDSEVYLEYPLSASSPRHRAAKLKVVVRCTCIVDLENSGSPDLDLEAFLSDKFPQNSSEFPHEGPEIEHFQRGSVDCQVCAQDAVPDAIRREQEYLPRSFEQVLCERKSACRQKESEIHLLKNLEGNLVGLNTKLKQFVAQYAHTKSVFGQFRKEKNQSAHLSKSDLHAAVFFAAGVTMQKHLHCLETASNNTIVYLRTKSEDFDASSVQSSVDASIAEVVTLSGDSCIGLDIDPFDIPECSSNSSGDESVLSYGNQIEGRDADGLQGGGSDRLRCSTCTAADSKLPDSPTLRHSSSWRSTESEMTNPLISTSATTSKKRKNVGVMIRNVLGVLLIAGVSFALGAKGASFVGSRKGRTTGMTTDDNSNWTENQQMGAWKELDVSQEHMVGQLETRSNSMRNFQSITSKLADKTRLPDQLRENHRKLVTLRWSNTDEGSSTLSAPIHDQVPSDNSTHVEVLSWKQEHMLVPQISAERGDLLQHDVSSMSMDIGMMLKPILHGGKLALGLDGKVLCRQFQEEPTMEVLRARKMLKG